MKKIGFLLLGTLLVLSSCGDDKKAVETKTETKTEEVKTFDDSKYVISDAYPLGDVRRYGIFPDSVHSAGHRGTGKTRIETILDMSSEHDIEMTFPKGYYKTALIIKGKQNVKLKFEDAEFGGIIQILENDTIPSSNVTMKGNLVSYAGFFTRNSNDISIDNLALKANKAMNIYSIRNKGCHIYDGSKDIKINTLIVEELGSGNDKYKNVHAGLTVNGGSNIPEGVKIDKVHIKSSDRHGVILTGKEIEIGEVVIDKFGAGNTNGIAAMPGMSNKGDEKKVTGLWVNRCYDSFIDSVTINAGPSKGSYVTNFENGKAETPVEIKALNVLNGKASLPMQNKDADFMNVGGTN